MPAALLLAAAALTAAVTASGAYHASGQWLLAALLGAGVVAALRARPRSRTDAARAPLLACAALALWALVSGALAGDLAGAGRAIALVALVAGTLVVCDRATPEQREAFAGPLIGVGLIAAATGWIGVAWRVEPWAIADPDGTWRAATSITYTNAAAALLAPLALLALARLIARPRSAGAAIAVCALLVGLGATQSRGGALALIAGGIVLAVLLGPRALARATAAPALGAAVALAGLAPSFATNGPARPGVAAIGLIAGLAVAAAGARLPTRGGTALLAGCAVLLSGMVVWAAPSLDSRLTLSSRGRTPELSAALRVFRDHPLTGVGPGRATFTWQMPDGRVASIRYAHDEYVQVLAELGVIGLIGVVALLATLMRGAWLGRRAARAPGVHAAALAGLVALAVQSGFDFLWHVPAVVLFGALLAGMALPSHRSTRPRPREQ